MRHHWYENVELAAQACEKFNYHNLTVYHGCANFTTKTNRKNTNVASVNSLWIDIDIGVDPGKYPTQYDALCALKIFLTRYKLPTPMVVNSGGGLHVYFPFGEPIEVDVALPVAKAMKILASQDGFKIDTHRTADLSSILRPIGTRNFKYDPPRPIEVFVEGEICNFDDFADAVFATGVEVPVPVRKTSDPATNAVFMPFVNVPADANKVADKCKQMGMMRATRGNIAEPVWYAGLELLFHCAKGKELSHEWSKGHPEYSVEATDKKIEQIRLLGPTTCTTFEGRNPSGCSGCPYRGKITSPIQLGTEREELTKAPPAKLDLVSKPVTSAPKLESDVFIPPPRPFKRTSDGVVMLNEDGIETLIYPYDLYLHEIAYDPIERHEVATIRHWLPQEGWKEFSFRSAEVASERDFEKAMRDNHVKPFSVKGMRAYIVMYMNAVQHAKKMRYLHSTMGWKNGTGSFVLGRTEFFADGSEQSVGVAASVVSVVDGIGCRGTIDNWVATTAILDRPDMEAHAFLFGCGAAAPLMKFTGYECALVNAVGMTNSGKTSMARMFMSMYGDFDLLKLRQRDTTNAKIARLGLMGSLPVYIDEITNEDPNELSDLIYEFTQGRSKLRLRTDGSERDTFLWNTVVVSTSNAALLAKLAGIKTNPEAERMRVFEFKVNRTNSFEQSQATAVFRMLTENFGIVGALYIKYIVTHQNEVKRLIEAATTYLQDIEKTLPEERMRVAVVSAVITGLTILKRLGLIAFDESRIGRWALDQIKRMRGLDLSYRVDSLEVLGLYINETSPQRILVQIVARGGNQGDKFVVLRHPIGGLLSRYELNSQKLWIDLRHFRRWAAEHQEDPDYILEGLTKGGVVSGIKRKSLGMGGDMATSAINTIEVNLDHADLGNVLAQLVDGEAKVQQSLRGAA